MRREIKLTLCGPNYYESRRIYTDAFRERRLTYAKMVKERGMLEVLSYEDNISDLDSAIATNIKLDFNPWQ